MEEDKYVDEGIKTHNLSEYEMFNTEQCRILEINGIETVEKFLALVALSLEFRESLIEVLGVNENEFGEITSLGKEIIVSSNLAYIERFRSCLPPMGLIEQPEGSSV